jgi:hypothetical protein
MKNQNAEPRIERNEEPEEAAALEVSELGAVSEQTQGTFGFRSEGLTSQP